MSTGKSIPTYSKLELARIKRLLKAFRFLAGYTAADGFPSYLHSSVSNDWSDILKLLQTHNAPKWIVKIMLKVNALFPDGYPSKSQSKRFEQAEDIEKRYGSDVWRKFETEICDGGMELDDWIGELEEELGLEKPRKKLGPVHSKISKMLELVGMVKTALTTREALNDIDSLSIKCATSIVKELEDILVNVACDRISFRLVSDAMEKSNELAAIILFSNKKKNRNKPILASSLSRIAAQLPRSDRSEAIILTMPSEFDQKRILDAGSKSEEHREFQLKVLHDVKSMLRFMEYAVPGLPAVVSSI